MEALDRLSGHLRTRLAELSLAQDAVFSLADIEI